MAADEYRRHAAECLRIAEGITDSRHGTLLIDMAQAWQRLAHRAEKNRPVMQQQQQQQHFVLGFYRDQLDLSRMVA